MSTDSQTIKQLARESLMPDFFGARVDEEGLWEPLRQLLGGIQTPNVTINKIKAVAGQATSATDFIEKIKTAKLWLELKELVQRVQVK